MGTICALCTGMGGAMGCPMHPGGATHQQLAAGPHGPCLCLIPVPGGAASHVQLRSLHPPSHHIPMWTLERFRWGHWVAPCSCYMGAAGPSDLTRAGFNHGAPRWGSGSKRSSTGGCRARMLRRKISSCPGGKVFSCCLQKRAGLSLIRGLLCFSHLSMTASREKGRSPWGGFSPLAGVRGFRSIVGITPAACLAPTHGGGRHCAGVTPAAGPAG